VKVVVHGLTCHVRRKVSVASLTKKPAIPHAGKAKKGLGARSAPTPLEDKKRTPHKQAPKASKVKPSTFKGGRIHSIRDRKWAPLAHLLTDRKEMDEETLDAISAVSSSLVTQNTIYTFRLVVCGQLSSDSGGVYRGAVSWDPSSLSEYSSYLSNMFNQVRLNKAVIHLGANNNAGIDGNSSALGRNMAPVVWSSDLNFTNSTPASNGAVQENPDSHLVPTTAWSAGGTIHVFSSISHPNSLWADVGAPVPEADTGCYGQFQYASVNTMATSTYIQTYMLELYLDFRSRT